MSEITPDQYMESELLKKQLNLDSYTDKQIVEIRDSFRKSADRMLAYVKKKETAKAGSGGWTKDRYLKILSDLAVLDKTLQGSLVDKTLDAGKAAFVSELKNFEDVLSVKGLSSTFEHIKISPDKLKAYLEQTDIGGKVLKDWTDKAFTKTVQDKIRLEIMSDSLLGESYSAIESRLKKAYSDIDKSLIESIVRTHIQSVNNKALQAVAEKNKAIIKKVKWSAALDSASCMICGALDGNIYPINSPIAPPIHIRCRCCMIPIVKTWEELGVKSSDVEDMKSKKAIRPDNFKEGVPAKTNKTYAEKFEEFTEADKIKLVGIGRYKYLKEGKLEFKDLVNEKTGELYKVADLDKAITAKLKKEAKQEQSDKITETLISKTRAEQVKKAAQVEKAQVIKSEMLIKKEAAEALAKKEAAELAAKEKVLSDYKASIADPKETMEFKKDSVFPDGIYPPCNKSPVPDKIFDFHYENKVYANESKKKSAGAIVYDKESDKVWIVEPTNHFGGYKHTYPKGGIEGDVFDIEAAQKSAVKEV